ncbi:hypothetical protein [Aeoliella mucimassa]|uniref:Uncharacterized protein n=1 Tax=Aeoliella mucimassa TaxID=2527972 RepID=A0A518AQJ9_9BACT|nr:hypothetical protein [Aeoliella mucimassa]QDU57002.1 hypothetical protein Pan181_32140 [Aeoliella mucimassa]
MGACTWLLVSFAAWARYGRFGELFGEGSPEFEIYCFLLAPLHLLTTTLSLPSAGYPMYLLKLASGVLMHAMFWIAVLTWYQSRRSRVATTLQRAEQTR